MIWKTLLTIFIIVIICLTTYIVWNNRSSEKILTNFTSALVVGIIGVLAASLISLKEEKITDTYASCIFVQKQPLYLMNYGVRMKINRTIPIIFTNNSIANLLKKDSTQFDKVFPINNSQKWRLFENLFVRYLFDLLESRYMTSWYLRTYELRVPGGYKASSWPVETLDSTLYDNEKLSKVFPENEFINVGKYNNLERESNTTSSSYMLKLPPNTRILYKSDTLNSPSIQFDNDFINIEIKFKYSLSIQSIDDDVAKAYKINITDNENYIFIPFLIETTTKYKKFKSGHPDMEKYKYWTNDMLIYLKNNISISEFWEQVKVNQ